MRETRGEKAGFSIFLCVDAENSSEQHMRRFSHHLLVGYLTFFTLVIRITIVLDKRRTSGMLVSSFIPDVNTSVRRLIGLTRWCPPRNSGRLLFVGRLFGDD